MIIVPIPRAEKRELERCTIYRFTPFGIFLAVVIAAVISAAALLFVEAVDRYVSRKTETVKVIYPKKFPSLRPSVKVTEIIPLTDFRI